MSTLVCAAEKEFYASADAGQRPEEAFVNISKFVDSNQQQTRPEWYHIFSFV